MGGDRSGPPSKTSRHSHRSSRGKSSSTIGTASVRALGGHEVDRDTRDKVIALQVDLQALRATVAEMRAQQAETNETVKELRDMLVAAKGARWVLMGLIATGGFLGGVFAKLPAWIQFFPKV